MANFVKCSEEQIKFTQKVPEQIINKPPKKFLGITISPALKEYKFSSKEYYAINKTVNLDKVFYIEKIKANLHKYSDVSAYSTENGDFYAIRFYYGGEEDDEIWCYNSREERDDQYLKISSNSSTMLTQTSDNIKQKITEILYKNSSDDTEALRIKFENIEKVTNLLTNLIKKHDK